MKTRITFIEFNHHFEVLRPMLELVDLSRFTVQVAVRSIFYEQFDYQNRDDLEWVLFPETEVQSEWIEKINNLSSQELVIVVTGRSHRSALAKRLNNVNYALLIHNYMPTFHPYKIDFKGAGFRDLLRGLKHLLYYPGLKKLLKGASHIFYLNDQVHPQVSDHVRAKYPVVSSPSIFYRSALKSEAPMTERKKIVLPGTVKPNGRDYEGVGRALQELSDTVLAQLHLHLLGAASSAFAQTVIESYQKLQDRGLKMTTHNHVISQAVYDRVFQNADLILCPYQARFRLGLHTDKFGLTSISGTMNDLIRFGRPALVSRHHPFPPELEKSVVRYHDVPHLAEKLSLFTADDLIFDTSIPEQYQKEHCRTSFNQWLIERL